MACVLKFILHEGKGSTSQLKCNRKKSLVAQRVINILMGFGGKRGYHVRCPYVMVRAAFVIQKPIKTHFISKFPLLYVISCHVISAKASECRLKIDQPTAKFLLFWVILIEAVLNSCRSECPSLGELVVGFCSDGFELKWRIAVGVTISFLLTCITTRGAQHFSSARSRKGARVSSVLLW